MRDRADSDGKRDAYVFLADGEEREHRLTYAQLDREARSIAVLLRRHISSGDRALLLYPPGLEFIAGLFGCWYANVIAVPAYPPRAGQRSGSALDTLASIANDSAPAVVLTVARLRDTIEASRPSIPALAHALIIATDEVPQDFIDEWTMPQDVSPDTIASLQYTSGSTAAPKGVMLAHRNLLHNSAIIAKCFANSSGSIGVSWLPPYHDMGLIGGILQPMHLGVPIVLMAPAAFLQRPIRWLKAIAKYRADTSGGPNFAYDLCAQRISDEDRKSLDLSSWTLAFNGAEPVLPHTIDRFAEAFAPCGFKREAFYPCYGMAEATLLVSGGERLAPPTVRTVAGADNQKMLVGCGHAHLDTQIAIVDPESRKRVFDGTVGEIWVSGESIAKGYWRKPDESRETFDARIADTNEGPFLRTGDLGLLDAGELFITGRLKDLIIIRGVNYYPQDIENTAQSSHAALRPGGGAAFSVNGDGAERLVVLHEVERTQRDADPDEVIGNIRQAVAEQHEVQVSAVVLLKPGQLLYTSSGKIRRRACREAFVSKKFEVLAEWNQPTEETNAFVEAVQQPAAPKISQTAEELEGLLVDTLAAALQMKPEEIDPADAFARYGLDSAGAAQVASNLEQVLGRELPLTLFYDYPSPRDLARHLSQHAAPTATTGANELR